MMHCSSGTSLTLAFTESAGLVIFAFKGMAREEVRETQFNGEDRTQLDRRNINDMAILQTQLFFK